MYWFIGFLRTLQIVILLLACLPLFPFKKGYISSWLLNIITFPIILPFAINRRIRGKDRNQDIKETLIKLGPVFIKLGQLLAGRADFIAIELALMLEDLQDNVPSIDFAEIDLLLKRNLGNNYLTYFASFNQNPIAAASIAQVYEGQLWATNSANKSTSPKKVVVKVIKPKARIDIYRDISALRLLLKTCKLFNLFGKMDLERTISLIEKGFNRELDLRIEAATCKKFKNMLSDEESCYIPEVYWNHTTADVLVMELLEGFTISNVDYFREQYSPEFFRQVAYNLIKSYFVQVYQNGFFHADLHGGNIFVLKDGRVGLIDFGIISILSNHDLFFVSQIVASFLKRDYQKVALLYKRSGYINSQINSKELEIACIALGEPIFSEGITNFSLGNLVAQLLSFAEQYGMKLQPQLLLLKKTILLVENSAQKLDPTLNVWEILRPLFAEWRREKKSLPYMQRSARKLLKEARTALGSQLEEYLALELLPPFLNSYKARDGLPENPPKQNSSTLNRVGILGIIYLGIILTVLLFKN